MIDAQKLANLQDQKKQTEEDDRRRKQYYLIIGYRRFLKDQGLELTITKKGSTKGLIGQRTLLENTVADYLMRR